MGHAGLWVRVSRVLLRSPSQKRKRSGRVNCLLGESNALSHMRACVCVPGVWWAAKVESKTHGKKSEKR